MPLRLGLPLVALSSAYSKYVYSSSVYQTPCAAPELPCRRKAASKAAPQLRRAAIDVRSLANNILHAKHRTGTILAFCTLQTTIY